MANYESYRKRGNTTGTYSLAPVAISLAEAEGLAAHEQAIRTRMRVRQQ